MGIDMHNIVIYGYKLDYHETSELLCSLYKKDDAYTILEELDVLWREEKEDNCSVIFDGMNGEYIMVGYLLACSESSRWDTGSFTRVEDVSVEDFHKIAAKDFFKKIFKGLVPENEPKTMVFSHYT